MKVFVEKAVEDGVGAHHEHCGEVNPGEHNHHSLLVLTNLDTKLIVMEHAVYNQLNTYGLNVVECANNKLITINTVLVFSW